MVKNSIKAVLSWLKAKIKLKAVHIVIIQKEDYLYVKRPQIGIIAWQNCHCLYAKILYAKTWYS